MTSYVSNLVIFGQPGSFFLSKRLQLCFHLFGSQLEGTCLGPHSVISSPEVQGYLLGLRSNISSRAVGPLLDGLLLDDQRWVVLSSLRRRVPDASDEGLVDAKFVFSFLFGGFESLGERDPGGKMARNSSLGTSHILLLYLISTPMKDDGEIIYNRSPDWHSVH